MTRGTELATAAGELRIVLAQLVRRLRLESTRPISQGAALGRLEREGPKTTSSLAASERVRPQSMAETLAELQKDGLVDRYRDPDDGRQILVYLTDAGRAALAEDRRRREGWLAQSIAESLSEEEQVTLLAAVELLRRIAES
jgi:DNA-binding MarR family transcriptional regulator